jgi:hypothetical protein
MHPTIASDEDMEIDEGPDPVPVEKWDWTDELIAENIRKSLDGLFHSSIEAYFITATRSEPAHRLSPHLFRIALARRLRLPVHTYRRICKCKKWLDIFGDHYFDCHTHYPKTALHNRVRDGFYHVFCDIAMHTPNMESEKDVHHEPTNVAPSFPTVRPGDVVLQLHNHKRQACAIDFSMVGTPEGATNVTKQRKKYLQKHTVRELQKWKGMSKPRVKPRAAKQTNSTPPPNMPSNPPVPDEPELDPAILKHHVIQNLHDNGISMVPATVGPFGDFGPMLNFLLYGTFPTDVNYTTLLSSHRVGVAHTKEMCLTARIREPVKALLPSADMSWRQHFGRRWFGPTYQDMSPLPSARKNIGIMIARQMAQHLSIGANKAASKFVSHDPPTRPRPTKSYPTIGRLPLSSDRASYGVPMDIDNPTEILFDSSLTAIRAPVADFEGELV